MLYSLSFSPTLVSINFKLFLFYKLNTLAIATLADLKKHQTAEITDVSSNEIPLKLLEMGCLPGNTVKIVQMAPFADPMYLNINGSHLAIRKETAEHILIRIING